MKRFLWGVLLMSMSFIAQAGNDVARVLAPFPASEQGQVRWVIDLPALPDEDSYKVELLPGKRMSVDCNRHWAQSEVKQLVLQGWGYSYYVMDKVGDIAATRMACPGQEKENRFVSVAQLPELLRYNSRMPIVFYAPEGVELRYRIWKATAEDRLAQQR